MQDERKEVIQRKLCCESYSRKDMLWKWLDAAGKWFKESYSKKVNVMKSYSKMWNHAISSIQDAS